MDSKSKRQLNAQQSSAYYGARSVGTLSHEGMIEQPVQINMVPKPGDMPGSDLHSSFPQHPQVKHEK